MNIKEIMTKSIIYADINNTIDDVANLMKTYDIGFIPIKDNGQFIGVITDRDIVIKAINNNDKLDQPIKEFITSNIISIDISKRLEDAVKLMSDYQIRRLMVKNKDKFVGIISLSDILSIKHDFDILKYISKIFMPNDKMIFQNDIDLPQAEIDEFEL
jgi:CBS domain-containing protein